MLCLAETLLQAGDAVTFAVQEGAFDRDALARYFRVTLDGAEVVAIPGDLDALRTECRRLSHSFDICIYLTNYRFFDSGARQTFVILQIPYGRITLFTLLVRLLRGELREAAKDVLRVHLLRRLQETQAVVVYSQFVHDALERLYNIPSTILPPPIDDFSDDRTPKERVILSVGRFFRGLYNDKRYDVLIDAFKQLYARLPQTSWMYRLVGSCGSDPASQRYLEELREAAHGFPIYFYVNSSYEELRRHYNEATIFWHAAGFGVDDECHPERAEHFGMSTLEAMSARCVPVAVNRGGQKEIVSHGESGYLWNSVDELVEYTIALIENPALLGSMQHKARERFTQFRRDRFAERVLSLLA